MRRYRSLFRWLLVGGCVAALAWTVATLGPREVLRAARGADPRWLALSVVPVVGRFLIWGVKWTRVLGRKTAVPYAVALRILLCGSFVNLTTPTAKLGGGFVRAALLRRRYGWGLAEAYGRAFADQGTTVLGSLLLYGLLAVSAAFAVPGLPGAAVLGASGALVLAALAAGVALRGWAWRGLHRPRVRAWIERRTPARLRAAVGDSGGDWLEQVFGPLLGEGSAIRNLAADIAWGSLSFASICMANALVLRALGVDAPALPVAAAVVLGYFAGSISGAGGIGVTEAALTGLYIQFGIPGEAAAAGALLHRATLYLVVVVWGGASLIVEGRASDAAAH